jgi:hypothetical protein
MHPIYIAKYFKDSNTCDNEDADHSENNDSGNNFISFNTISCFLNPIVSGDL